MLVDGWEVAGVVEGLAVEFRIEGELARDVVGVEGKDVFEVEGNLLVSCVIDAGDEMRNVRVED